jgi:hypothetical protein
MEIRPAFSNFLAKIVMDGRKKPSHAIGAQIQIA